MAPDDGSGHPAVELVFCLFFWSQLLIQMKLQSLCDMATVPRTPPLGVANVPLCWNPFLAIVCVFPVHCWAGGSQVLGSRDSACSHPSVVCRRAYFLFKPDDNNTGKHCFCLAIMEMCWNVLTKACFIINPVCVRVWMVVKGCHALNLYFFLSAYKDVICWSLLTSPLSENSVVLWLVLTGPTQTGNDVHLSITGYFTL